MPLSFDRIAATWPSGVWVTDDWTSGGVTIDSDGEGLLSFTGWAWARTFFRYIPPDRVDEWLRRIFHELEVGGGAFRVTGDFLAWQAGLS